VCTVLFYRDSILFILKAKLQSVSWKVCTTNDRESDENRIIKVLIRSSKFRELRKTTSFPGSFNLGNEVGEKRNLVKFTKFCELPRWTISLVVCSPRFKHDFSVSQL